MTKKPMRFFIILLLLLTGCGDNIWNSPRQQSDYAKNIHYGSFSSPPKTLDPAQSYSIDENLFLAQIYESPLQYHYLKRPYTLEPLTIVAMPIVRYWNKNNLEISTDAPIEQIAYTTYDMTVKPGIFYQPHPAFAQAENGQYLYHHLTATQMKNISELADFSKTATRELLAEDYVYQIKRLAHPHINSPILGLMNDHILGLVDYAKTLRLAYEYQPKTQHFFDLRKYNFQGVKVIDKYSYRITLKGKYQQFLYWLTMPFFAPIPWEVDYFYSQPGMQQRNLTLNWQPVGTGAYLLAKNNPNKEMILQRNPNFHTEYYPTEGAPVDKEQGYLIDAGKKLPFVDTFVFTLEKEVIPRWSKFLQGYYDQSTISADNYGEAIQIDQQGEPKLTLLLQKKQMRLQTQIEPNVYYFGFNMLDDVVGGYSESAKKLRQAIGIILDQSEFIYIFMNGRGLSGHSPIPPGVFGYAKPENSHINNYIYNSINGVPVRKSIQEAKKLLAEAGYPNGQHAKTGEPLVIRYDTTTTSPADQDQFIWIRKQFAKLGIELNVEATDPNRFQEKMRNGDIQFFFFGWIGDYPDPENFLFMLYGPNGQVKYNGVNGTNYQNNEYDDLFKQMQQMPNDELRFGIIQKMIAIINEDAPWVGEIFPKSFLLSQSWLQKYKPNSVANNVLKYQRLYPEKREMMIKQWNQPILWPIALMLLIILLLILPAVIVYYRKTHQPNNFRLPTKNR